MKKEKKRISCRLLFITAALSLLTGCMVDEYTEEVPPTPGGTGEAEVEFTMQVPGNMSSATKTALTEEQEKEVKTIELLVFEPGGDGNYRYTVFADMEQATYENGEIKFKVKLTQGLSDIVVLANSRDIILGSTAITASNTKSTVLASLIQQQSTDGKWIDGSYKPIPMFGYLGEVTVKENESLPEITLIRMLARINVTLSDNAHDSLKLSEIYLYNPYTQGYVIPDMDNLVKAGDEKYKKVNAPSVTGLDKRDSDDPIYYHVWTYSDDAETTKEFVNRIYTFEADQGVDPEITGNEEDMLKNTILVLGGYYMGSTTKTYYRIDFHNSKDGLGFLPLLRNHSYEVGITQVSGPGFTEPGDALKSKPMNITASVKGWVDADMGDVFFDGQYYLTRNKGEFTLYRDAYTDDPDEDAPNILSLQTDYPEGWQIDSITWEGGSKTETVNRQDGWLDASSWSGSGDDTKHSISLLLDANNTPGNREGYLYITAGRMKFAVKVIQTNQANLALSITDMYDNPISELVFGSGKRSALLPQRFRIHWAPKDRDLTISNYTQGIEADDIFHFATGSITAGDEFRGGSVEFLIAPPAVTEEELQENPLLERETRIEFMAANDDSRLFQSISLRQIHYDIILEDIQASYLLNETHTIHVRSNTSWYVAEIDDPANILAAGEKERILKISGGYNKTNGEPLSFTLNPDGNDMVATVTFRNLYGLCEDVVLSIRGTSNHPNSYIIRPGTSLHFNPRKAYEVWREYLGTDLGSFGTGWTAEILWTDAPGLITGIELTNESAGPGASINVTTAGAEGNALIALKHNGNVYWTWHIWVTNYNPERDHKSFTYSVNQEAQTIHMMDRYLGALTNAPGDWNNQGCIYEWGSPRPSATMGEGLEKRIHHPFHRVIYERGEQAGRTESYYNTQLVAAEENNLKNYILNPRTLYRDNYWHGTTMEMYLWCDQSGNKGVFDPCPLGWRTPGDNEWFNQAQVISYGTDGVELAELGYFPHTATRSPLQGVGSTLIANWSIWGGAWFWSGYKTSDMEDTYCLGEWGSMSGNIKAMRPNTINYTNSYVARNVRCVKE